MDNTGSVMNRLLNIQDVVKAVDRHTFDTADGLCLDDDITCILEEVPYIESDYRFNEWCDTCKEYDQEKHCCHRFNQVIRKTAEEVFENLTEDAVSRQKAKEACCKALCHPGAACPDGLCKEVNEAFDDLPSLSSKPKEIGYVDCANAMMKMWIDNVLTDGEYNRIMDKLNAYWKNRRQNNGFDK